MYITCESLRIYVTYSVTDYTNSQIECLNYLLQYSNLVHMHEVKYRE